MGGLFDEISKEGYSPEYLLSIDHLNDNKSFIDFYHKRLLVADKKPNIVHEWIAELEKRRQIFRCDYPKYRWVT